MLIIKIFLKFLIEEAGVILLIKLIKLIKSLLFLLNKKKKIKNNKNKLINLNKKYFISKIIKRPEI
jgi:hypothetical protein